MGLGVRIRRAAGSDGAASARQHAGQRHQRGQTPAVERLDAEARPLLGRFERGHGSDQAVRGGGGSDRGDCRRPVHWGCQGRVWSRDGVSAAQRRPLLQ